MYTDLFLALLNRKNEREHPILSALLYAFCPAAAHWWLVGADPMPPFDFFSKVELDIAILSDMTGNLIPAAARSLLQCEIPPSAVQNPPAALMAAINNDGTPDTY